VPDVPRLLAICAVERPGGAEIGLLRLIERLHDWDVTIATPGPGPLAARAAAIGARVEHLRVGGLGAGEGARALASWPRAPALARAHDVAYCNGGVAARLLPALRGARTVLHVHDLVDRVPRHWRSADVVLADSQAVADRLDRLDAHVVGCPVELDVAPVAQPPWPPADGPVVGYVGRIEPRKGVLDLARAAPAIRSAVPGARVVLVGSDAYEADAGYGARVAAVADVERCGWVERADALMAHLDVLVLPSYAEPFGTVLAEAMAAGTPVVATAVGGLPEVVRDGVEGLLVPPGRPDALAAAVVEALGRREQLSAAGRRAARRFAADGYAERVEALIAP
jgi:glycosyltransferase involved in cell wall biosynthesis